LFNDQKLACQSPAKPTIPGDADLSRRLVRLSAEYLEIEPLLVTHEAAAYLGFDPYTVARMAREAEIPAAVLCPFSPENFGFLRSDLDAWLQSATASGNSTSIESDEVPGK
jgi:predicted DNA-binding transcriptional regulator AlpA